MSAAASLPAVATVAPRTLIGGDIYSWTTSSRTSTSSSATFSMAGPSDKPPPSRPLTTLQSSVTPRRGYGVSAGAGRPPTGGLSPVPRRDDTLAMLDSLASETRALSQTLAVNKTSSPSLSSSSASSSSSRARLAPITHSKHSTLLATPTLCSVCVCVPSRTVANILKLGSRKLVLMMTLNTQGLAMILGSKGQRSRSQGWIRCWCWLHLLSVCLTFECCNGNKGLFKVIHRHISCVRMALCITLNCMA